MPTETVYGLAGDACNDAAVAGIFALKQRPQFNPLIVHVTDAAMAQRYVAWNDTAQRLSAAFWPGALTLVLPRLANCPLSLLVSAGGDSVAVRCPAHPIARQLIAAFDGGIAAPSANRSGKISPTQASHVRDEFPDSDLLVLDGGASTLGIESTVVDVCDGVASILRHGSITAEEIRAIGVAVEESAEPSSRSPGQLLSHYAPSLPVRLNASQVNANEALLAFGGAPLSGAASTLNLSPSGDVVEAAANLFAFLRALDRPEHAAIAVMPIPESGVGVAINDRLKRAAWR